MAELPSRDRDLEAIAFDLESDVDETRKAAIFAAVKLGERSVKLIPQIQKMAGEDTAIELRYLARKALAALAELASPSQRSQGGSRKKSAGVTQKLAVDGATAIASGLLSPQADVRASSLRACALRRDPALLPALVGRIGHEPDAELRSLLVRVLGIVGGKAVVKAVVAFLQDSDARVRANAIEVLSGFQDVTAFAYIARCLQDPDHRIQVASATALQALGSLNIVKVGRVMMGSTEYWARDAAAYMLALAKVSEAVPILEAGLSDVHEPVKIKCKAGLEKLAAAGNGAAQEALKKAAGIKAKEDPFGSFLAMQELQGKKKADQIDSSDPGERRRATRTVAALGMLDEGHLPLLLSRLKVESDPAAMANIVSAIGKIRNPVALPALKDYTTHKEEQVRAALADSFGQICTDDSLNAAIPFLKDASPTVVGRAILALRSHAYIDIAKPLEELAAGQLAQRKMAAMVIGELADQRFVPLLEKLAAEPTPEVAGTAREILKMMRAAPPPPAPPPSRITGAFAPPIDPSPPIAEPAPPVNAAPAPTHHGQSPETVKPEALAGSNARAKCRKCASQEVEVLPFGILILILFAVGCIPVMIFSMILADSIGLSVHVGTVVGFGLLALAMVGLSRIRCKSCLYTKWSKDFDRQDFQLLRASFNPTSKPTTTPQAAPAAAINVAALGGCFSFLLSAAPFVVGGYYYYSHYVSFWGDVDTSTFELLEFSSAWSAKSKGFTTLDGVLFVPEIRFTVKNRTSSPIKSLVFRASFTDENSVIKGDYIRETIETLPAGFAKGPIIMHGAMGFTGPLPLLGMKTSSQKKWRYELSAGVSYITEKWAVVKSGTVDLPPELN